MDRGMDSDRPYVNRRGEYGVVNIAQGNAVVGRMVGGRVTGPEVFAWVEDFDGDVWLLAGLTPDGTGGLYEESLPGGRILSLAEIDDTLNGCPVTPGPLVAWVAP